MTVTMHAFSHNLDQVTYPRMERQDLTQGQLGSFKFTPTDQIHHVFPTFSPQPALQSVLSSDESTGRGQSAFHSTNTSTTAPTRPSATSPNQSHAVFFDTFVKPDLNKFRLRSGPPALRAAVDSVPASPQRQHKTEKFHLPVPNITACTMQPQDREPLADQSAIGSASTTSVPTVDVFQTDGNLLYASLVQALATEQQAHKATKDALEKEKHHRVKAEADASRFSEQNRSLAESVEMLRGLIRNSMKEKHKALQKAALDDFHKRVEAQIAIHSGTILHDAVKNLKKPPIQNPEPSADLYDFDLFERHTRAASRNNNRPMPAPESTPETAFGPLIAISDDEAELPCKLGRRGKTGTTVTADVSDMTAVGEDSQESDSTNQDAPKLMAMPFDVHVQWNRDPVFDNPSDKFDRLGRQVSIFAEHPVRFLPNKFEKDVYRTTMIDFIPLDTTYKEVLKVVRGGVVESIQLVGAIGRATNFMTARVVFKYEQGARNVYMQGQSPGIKVKGQRLRVWQLLEATYPRNIDLEQKIFNYGFTRLLLIKDAMQASLDKLPEKISPQVRSGAAVEITTAFDATPMIEFTSIAECSKTLDQLRNDPDFRGSRFDFEMDPCDSCYSDDGVSDNRM